MAGGLAFLAGATDVHGLTLLRDLFVSFMSGNSTMLGVAIARGDFERAGRIAGIVALFVAGATAGSLIATLAGPRHTVVVLLIVTVLLALPMLVPQWSIPFLVVAMGLLNAAMHRAGATGISLTYVTGASGEVRSGIGIVTLPASGGCVLVETGRAVGVPADRRSRRSGIRIACRHRHRMGAASLGSRADDRGGKTGTTPRLKRMRLEHVQLGCDCGRGHRVQSSWRGLAPPIHLFAAAEELACPDRRSVSRTEPPANRE